MFRCKYFSYYSTIRNAISQLQTGAKPKLTAYRGIKTTTFLQLLESSRLSEKSVSYNVRRNCNNLAIEDSTILESNIELDDIELCIAGEESLVLNLTWLRDSCHCSLCTHQYSRQRLFTVKDFRREKFSIKSVAVEPNSKSNWIHSDKLFDNSSDKCINVEWTDGHESVYSLNWLKYISNLNKISQLGQYNTLKSVSAFPKDDLYLPVKAKSPNPVHWDVETLKKNLVAVEYEDLVEGFKFSNEATFINANRISDISHRRICAMLSLAHQLVRFGIAKIINVPRERNQVLNIARSLTYERPTGYGTVFDVVVEPDEEINLAYSSLEFDIHTDLTYRETSPGVQLLHCIRDSIEGGLSYFSDAHKAAAILQETDPGLFNVLVQVPVTFAVRDPYRDMKLRWHQTVLSLDHEGNLSDVYYSPFMLPPTGFIGDIKLFYLALDKFTRILQSTSNKFITKMNPGEMFIFHNRRVLHGRSAYDLTTSGRFLQGCYMDWDEIKGLYEKLLSHNNPTSCID